MRRLRVEKLSSKGRHRLMKCANTCTMRRRSFTSMNVSTFTTMHNNTQDPSPPAVVPSGTPRQPHTYCMSGSLTSAGRPTEPGWRGGHCSRCTPVLPPPPSCAVCSSRRRRPPSILLAPSSHLLHSLLHSPARTPSSRAGTACRRRQGSTCSGPRLCAAARAGCASGRGWWCRTWGTCNVPQSLHSAPRCR